MEHSSSLLVKIGQKNSSSMGAVSFRVSDADSKNLELLLSKINSILAKDIHTFNKFLSIYIYI